MMQLHSSPNPHNCKRFILLTNKKAPTQLRIEALIGSDMLCTHRLHNITI